ncbi:MAG: AbrB/MazE/SpoVT family DNA-binding domain-containing protein [Clostridiaceae bacterium]|nr:AbrB/MazE/SpoVT family DNA-binding domain-containing protein [Clostridiaceae bacterium]
MSTTIQKWGNSLGIRIPQKIAKEYGFIHGSKVEIQTIGEGIIIRPAEPIPTLEELMAKITPENQHEEVDFGRAEGEEIW